ncbi:FMN-binding protein [Fusibacter paucivorans]|uniref:FMN-binding protein n=1 Tax=Fusibacter paucivorans TaxID=76009 RepID=A0ABS5PQ48_9FIRM|nr:FMN-binding protein [Fusibacter paucivorans]MBS7527294.1 FMN-binding protein [Fusibacter paucivorans]
MRKLLSLIMVVAMTAALLIGCGSQSAAPAENTTSNETPAATETPAAENTETPAATTEGYADGIYFAQDAAFPESGWKSVATFEVKDGKIVSADWNGANVAGGVDKKTFSSEGNYGMVEKAGAQAEWHEQAAKAEQYLIDNQSFDGINFIDDEGHTDTIAGVSIHVSDFVNLVDEALANGPSGKGPFTDGSYFAEDADFDPSNGWKENVSVTVINGYIVAANWNGTSEATDKDKKTYAKDGEYGMVANGGAIAEWDEQAAAVENFLIQSQDVDAITLNEEGKTDAVSGATIHVSNFVKLVKEALQ